VPCPNGDHHHYVLDAVHTFVATNVTVLQAPPTVPEPGMQVADPQV